jgi:hypothetical protein
MFRAATSGLATPCSSAPRPPAGGSILSVVDFHLGVSVSVGGFFRGEDFVLDL